MTTLQVSSKDPLLEQLKEALQASSDVINPRQIGLERSSRRSRLDLEWL